LSKLPAFQFYPGDWRKDMGVQSLSFHDRGVWWEMLCLMHESEKRGVLILNGKAMEPASLARLLGLDNQILTTTITSLLTSGVASRDEDTGAIYSRRMVRDEKLRKIRSEAGSKGGNPVLLNQNQTTGVNQNPTPSARTRAPKVKMKIEDEVENEEHSGNGVAHGISPEMMARGLAERLKVSLGYGPASFNTAVTEVAATEQKAGRNLEDLCTEMEAAYRFYEQEKPNLRITWGPAKFFGDGHWRDPPNWPRKAQTRQEKITAWRAPNEEE
jgi:hypothetical protein